MLVSKKGLIAGHGQLWMGDIPAQLRRLSDEPVAAADLRATQVARLSPSEDRQLAAAPSPPDDGNGTRPTAARPQFCSVVATIPKVGAMEVDPGLKEIRVTFDRDMAKSMSWTGGPPLFPPTDKQRKARWSSDGRTCSLPVSLKPGTDYQIGINNLVHNNFQSEWGVPLEPVVYTFRTRGSEKRP